jgi:hypothetical protein
MATTAMRGPIPLDHYPFVVIHGLHIGSCANFIANEAEQLRAIGAPWTAWAHRRAGWDGIETEHWFDLADGTARDAQERMIRAALARPQLRSRHAEIRALAATLGIAVEGR